MNSNFYKLTLLDIASTEKRSIISGPFGSNISSKYFQKDGIPVIRGNNLSTNSIVKFIDDGFVFVSEEKAEELDTYAIKDDIIFTAVGTIGQVGILGKESKYQKYVISNKQMRIRLNTNKVNPYYVYYWLTTSWILKSLINNNTGSAVPLLNLGILKRIPINLPKNRVYQDKIVNILSSLDKKIELNNKINKNLESMAKTLYDYWFVQFDFPDDNGKPYKSSGGKMIYSEELKREIPEGWEIKSLGDIVDIFDSKRVPLSKQEREKRQGTYPYYGATSIMDYIDDYIFDDEYILVAEDGSVMDNKGFPIIQFIWDKTWVNNHAHVLQAKKKENNEFLFYSLKMITVVKIMTGSIQKKINQENLMNVKIFIPNEQLLQEFSIFANPIRKKLINNIEENQKLTQLRDWLLPMLMNGQVGVE